LIQRDDQGEVIAFGWLTGSSPGLSRTRQNLFRRPFVCEHPGDMPQPATARLKPQRDTYLGYSIGCAAVWGALLAAAQRRLDPQSRRTLHIWCGAWWSGWTSATIARVGYPPPRPLTPKSKRRLEQASLVLVLLGLLSAIRMLIAGEVPRRR
jgi:hypothetical protein